MSRYLSVSLQTMTEQKIRASPDRFHAFILKAFAGKGATLTFPPSQRQLLIRNRLLLLKTDQYLIIKTGVDYWPATSCVRSASAEKSRAPAVFVTPLIFNRDLTLSFPAAVTLKVPGPRRNTEERSWALCGALNPVCAGFWCSFPSARLLTQRSDELMPHNDDTDTYYVINTENMHTRRRN